MYSLTPAAFEQLIARLLESFGWTTELVARTGDGGIDAVAARLVRPDFEFRMLVQAKRFAEGHKVGIRYVRELWSVKWKHGFHDALLATSSTFTRGARAQAEEWQLSLRDHHAIAKWARAAANKSRDLSSDLPLWLPSAE